MPQIKPERLAVVHAALGSFAEIPDREWEKASRSFGRVHLRKNDPVYGRYRAVSLSICL